MRLNQLGIIAKNVWQQIPQHFQNTSIGAFVIMPNHVHGIIIIESQVGARHAVPLLQQLEAFGKPTFGSIPTIVRSFKSGVTRQVNILQNTPGEKLWQRNYYEHVIRNEEDYQAIYDYIMSNPQNWENDSEFSDPDFRKSITSN